MLFSLSILDHPFSPKNEVPGDAICLFFLLILGFPPGNNFARQDTEGYNGVMHLIHNGVEEMAFDGLTVYAVAQQLEATLVGARIMKIYQPSRFDLVLHCRRPGGNHQLVISGHPQYPRIYLTEADYVNPLNPPAFCMLLRKHLEGGKITAVRQIGFERIIEIDVEALSDTGELALRTLIVEIMGRHSNVIIVDGESRTILDGLNRVTAQMSRYREIQPGEIYISPPPQDKANPLTSDWPQFISLLAPSSPTAKVSNVIVRSYQGISPVTAGEILLRAGFGVGATVADLQGDWEALYHEFTQLFSQLTTGEAVATLALDGDGSPVEFAPYPLRDIGTSLVKCRDISQAADRYYDYRINYHRLKEMAGVLNRIISTNINRLEKKISKQQDTLELAAQADTYRIQGELLTANLYQVQKGQDSITVTNFYSEDQEPISISLDPSLSPAENAQAYFKRYTKAKNSLQITEQQLQESRSELEYLEEVQTAIALAETIGEIEEIREELIAEGYLKTKPTKGRKQRKPDPAPPLQFISQDGFPIFVGRNNRQNDQVTFSIASSSDIWLHVKDIPGSHVIIKSGGKPVPDTTLVQAAEIAAYYSKARDSATAAVDYTTRQKVRKPKGAKPGKVIYDSHRTILVTPKPHSASREDSRQED